MRSSPFKKAFSGPFFYVSYDLGILAGQRINMVSALLTVVVTKRYSKIPLVVIFKYVV